MFTQHFFSALIGYRLLVRARLDFRRMNPLFLRTKRVKGGVSQLNTQCPWVYQFCTYPENIMSLSVRLLIYDVTCQLEKCYVKKRKIVRSAISRRVFLSFQRVCLHFMQNYLFIDA